MNTSFFSPLVAGTMTWGVWGKNLAVSRMADLIRTCVDQGISSFDHADIYGHYSTEAAFGRAFRQSGLARNAIQLISKCGIQLESADRKSIVKHYDYSRAHIIGSVEQSLRNLQTDYLDLFLLHRPSPLLMPAEVAEAVEQLRKAGKIREFGCPTSPLPKPI
jgi:predicted oxidoreductase